MRLSTSWMHVASIYASWSAVMEKSAMPENVPLCLSRRAAATSTLWRRIVLPDAISLKTAASPHRRPDCTAIDVYGRICRLVYSDGGLFVLVADGCVYGKGRSVGVVKPRDCEVAVFVGCCDSIHVGIRRDDADFCKRSVSWIRCCNDSLA